MEPPATAGSGLAQLAWVSALIAEGKYPAAAEAASEAFRSSDPSRSFVALCEWEDLAYAMRPVGNDAVHPAAAGVIPALEHALSAGHWTKPERAMLMARRLRLLGWSQTDRWRPEMLAAVAQARGCGQVEPLIYALYALHTTLGNPALVSDAVDVSAELVQLGRTHPSPVIRAMVHYRRYIDCLLTADSAGRDLHLGALLHASGEAGTTYWSAVADACLACDEVSQGHYERGDTLLRGLRERATLFPGLLTASLATVSTLLRSQRGQLGRGPEVSRTTGGLRAVHGSFGVGVAYFLALSGRTTEARVTLGDFDFGGAHRDSSYLACLAMIVELGVDHLHDRALVQTAADLMAPYANLMVVAGPAQGAFGPASYFLGKAAAYLGQTGAEDWFRQARDTAAAMRARPALAQALLHLGRLAPAGDPSAAAMLQEALAIAERIGFVAVANEARAALRPTAARSPVKGSTELTAREREILALTASGMTAAEVAQRLVLSPRTVEKHLQNAYTKIGARNRAEGVSWAMVNRLTEDA